jgi:hypothetical protein
MGAFDYDFEFISVEDNDFGAARFDSKGAGEALAATLCAAFKAVGDDFAVGLLANGEHELERYHWIEDTAKTKKGAFSNYAWTITLEPALYALYVKHEEEVPLDDEFVRRCASLGGPVMAEIPFKYIKVTPKIRTDPEWRTDARQYLAGVGVNNQGNVHMKSRPRILHDDLWFRHIEEQYVYEALLRRRIPMMPLPVVMKIDGAKRPDGVSGRIEPDFCLLYSGTLVIIEIDGGSHWETPADADKRLQFLREQGAIVRRLHADRCSDVEKAALAVSDALKSVDREIATR